MVEPVPGAQSLPVILVGNKSDVEVPETEADVGQSDAFFQYYLKNSSHAGKSQLDDEYLTNYCKVRTRWSDTTARDRGGTVRCPPLFSPFTHALTFRHCSPGEQFREVVRRIGVRWDGSK